MLVAGLTFGAFTLLSMVGAYAFIAHFHSRRLAVIVSLAVLVFFGGLFCLVVWLAEPLVGG